MTDEVGLDRNTGGFAALLGSFWDAAAGKFFTRRIRCTDDGASLVKATESLGIWLSREIPFATSASAKVRLDFGSAIIKAMRVRAVRTQTPAAAVPGRRFHVTVDAQTTDIDDAWLADPAPDDGTISLQRLALRADDFNEPFLEREFVDSKNVAAPIRYLSFKPNSALSADESFRLFLEVRT